MSANILLKTADSTEFTVEFDVIAQSKTISTMIKDLGLESMDTPLPIPVTNVDAATLEKVLEWCRQHKGEEIAEVPAKSAPGQCVVPEWDKEFLTVDQGFLISIIHAANYLDIPALQDYSCEMMAEQMKFKTPDELRKELVIENDFTPEEMENIKAQNMWCSE